MRQTPPANPEIRRRLKDRLLSLSPRAFEYFAGDLLTYLGLQDVEVTRYIGDGGIDAQGFLSAGSELVRVRTGVQVKRHRQNVRRPDVDRFIGALGGSFSHGIFITTADYAADALRKASESPLLRVSTITGNQVADLMALHGLGLLTPVEPSPRLDEDYYLQLEARASGPPGPLHDAGEDYRVADPPPLTIGPEDDLISLRALGYALRVDPMTVRAWVERGRLQPDRQVAVGRRDGLFFRRDRVETIRRQLAGSAQPASGAAWRQEFLDFARSRNLTKSYKPVLLIALLDLVDRNGEARMDYLARAFHAFYLERQAAGLPTEADGILKDPASAAHAEIVRLIVKFPLDRFLIKQFLAYDPHAGIVRFAPQLWEELRYYELLDVRASADAQLRYYYERLARQ
jgi:hypothetical protein